MGPVGTLAPFTVAEATEDGLVERDGRAGMLVGAGVALGEAAAEVLDVAAGTGVGCSKRVGERSVM